MNVRRWTCVMLKRLGHFRVPAGTRRTKAIKMSPPHWCKHRYSLPFNLNLINVRRIGIVRAGWGNT